jgi:hypothetical protein
MAEIFGESSEEPPDLGNRPLDDILGTRSRVRVLRVLAFRYTPLDPLTVRARATINIGVTAPRKPVGTLAG